MQTLTDLCNIMKSHGSDKGNDWHNYTHIYTILFEDNKQHIKNLFELGIGSVNPGIKSHMKKTYSPAGSLRGWREFFSKANIYAADIDRDILDDEERIQKFYVDQSDPNAIADLWQNNNMPSSFDIMIDDGLHDFSPNQTFFINSKHMLSDSGIYIIEDIPSKQAQQCRDELGKKVTELGYYWRLLIVKHKNNSVDNILMCITKPNTIYEAKIRSIPEELLNG